MWFFSPLSNVGGVSCPSQDLPDRSHLSKALHYIWEAHAHFALQADHRNHPGVPTANRICLLTQGPSDHPELVTGVSSRALVSCPVRATPDYSAFREVLPAAGAEWLTGRVSISGRRVLPPTPAMWQRYLLPWEGSDLSVGEHCFDKVCVGTASVSASMCVWECTQKAARVKDKGNGNAIKRHFFMWMLENIRCWKTSDHRSAFVPNSTHLSFFLLQN